MHKSSRYNLCSLPYCKILISMVRYKRIEEREGAKMKYYRIDVITEKEIITGCTTTNRAEAERQYDVWNETHAAAMFEMNI